MKFILFILLIFSSPVLSQPTGNKNLLLTNATTSPRPSEFDWNALTPQSPTAYSGSATVVVENKSFTNLNTGVLSGDLVQVTGNGHITFRNCYFGPAARNGITIGDGFTGTVVIENDLFVSQKMAIEVSESNCVVQISNSQCINPWGAPVCKGQFFQAVNSTMTNSYIRECAMENFLGLGSTEDWISFFNSGGTSGSRFIVEDNLVRGGGPSISGGGFMLGDHGGGYITVQNNKFLNPGNYQIAASGGNNFIVQNNLAYSSNTGYTRIGMYAYGQAGAACSNVTWQNNGMFIWNGNNWYPGDGSPSESCGTITGATPSFTTTNLTNLTLGQLALPTTIITFVNQFILYDLMKEGKQFRNVTGSCISSDVPVLNTIPIPTANAGSDQSIGGTSTTVNGSASTSTQGYNWQWLQVDGPVTVSFGTPNSSSSTVTGMSTPGVYTVMVVLTNNNGAIDSDRMTITKS